MGPERGARGEDSGGARKFPERSAHAPDRAPTPPPEACWPRCRRANLGTPVTIRNALEVVGSGVADDLETAAECSRDALDGPDPGAPLQVAAVDGDGVTTPGLIGTGDCSGTLCSPVSPSPSFSPPSTRRTRSSTATPSSTTSPGT